jgi:hypothetical protein
MRTWMTLFLAPALSLAVLADDKGPPKKPDPKAADAGALVVIDAAGKEQKLKTWKFITGTRHLGWLAPQPPEDKTAPRKPPRKDDEDGPPAKPAAVGPEALEVRPQTELKFAEGVLIFVPLDRLAAVDFDNEAGTMTAKVAVAGGEEMLTGTTKYKRINQVGLEAEVDKGDLGIAEVRYASGSKGIRGLRFPSPKAPAAAPTGRPASVTSIDGDQKTTHKVFDLMPLYRFADGSEKLLPTLAFRKTLKIDVVKITKITIGEADKDEPSWQVQMKDGTDEMLTLLSELEVAGRKGKLEGLVGTVPAGYAFFPTGALSEIAFDPSGDK